MSALVLEKKEEKNWVTYIKKRIKQNKNFMAFIGGPTGSGKSFSCISLAEMLDTTFNIDRIVFTGKALMEQINSDLPKGSVIVFEEAGIQMNNRNWQSKINKVLNFLAQTFRHKCLIILFNSPYIDFVDSATRRLFHAEFQTVSIDFKTQTTRLKPRLLQYNGRIGKMYYKRLIVLKKGKGSVKIDSLRLPKPSKDLLTLYEAKKTAFTTELNKTITNAFNEEVVGGQSKKIKDLTSIQSEIVELLKGGKTIPEIATLKGRESSSVYRSIDLIKKKGIKITPIRSDDGVRVVAYEVT